MPVTTKRLARKNIEEFLVEMKGILLDANFNPERGLFFKRNERRMILTMSIPMRTRCWR